MSEQITQVQIDGLKQRHDELVGHYNAAEGEDVLEEIATIEMVLISAGELTYGEEPFADA